MRIAVTDASIFIDLIFVGWMKHLPRLGFQIITTYEVLAELHDWQQALVEELASRNEVEIHVADSEELRKWKSQIETAKRLSHPDVTMLFLASRLGAMVLTGDKLVRTTSARLHIEVHGILWLFDQFLERGFVVHSEACEQMEALMKFNHRLPFGECRQRIEYWGSLKINK